MLIIFKEKENHCVTFGSSNVYHHLMLSRKQLLLTLLQEVRLAIPLTDDNVIIPFTVKTEVISLPHTQLYMQIQAHLKSCKCTECLNLNEQDHRNNEP